MRGLLEKTNVLVIGPMEEGLKEGEEVRKYIKSRLGKIKINVWDHYSRPFMEEVEESEDSHLEMNYLRKTKQFEELAKFKDIRRQDLSLVDTADIIICVFNTKTYTTGTFEELFLANSLRKPIFFVWGDGKENCPFWMFWTLPHQYIYGSLDEALETIKKINNRTQEIDSKRWRLKKYEYR